LGLFNDYTDIEHKVKTEPRKHELSLSVVIPFHAGRDILAKTVTSLTHQTYPKDRTEVIIAADANHADAKFIIEQYESNRHTRFNMVLGQISKILITVIHTIC
jgi:cellulose synthase/poly-beta-1,6-N-acetylglucosamine synthase-like glycosyltransferase